MRRVHILSAVVFLVLLVLGTACANDLPASAPAAAPPADDSSRMPADDPGEPPAEDPMTLPGSECCDVVHCPAEAVSAPVLVAGTGRVDAVDLAFTDEGLVVVWNENGTATSGVRARLVRNDGSMEEPTQLSEAWARTAEPQLTITAAGPMAAYTSNETGRFELHTRGLDARGAPVGPAQRISDHAELEVHPRFVSYEGALYVSWVGHSDEGVARTRIAPLRADGAPAGPAMDLPPGSGGLGPVEVASIPTGMIVTWVAETDGRSMLASQVRAMDGTTAEAVEPLAVEGEVAGSLAVASGPFGSAAVWETWLGAARSELRFRRLDWVARPSGPERHVSAPGARADTLSLAKMGCGYAVAYHSPDAEGGRAGGLSLLDETGSASRMAVASVAGRVAQTAVATGEGGGLAVAWIETAESGMDDALRVVSFGCETPTP